MHCSYYDSIFLTYQPSPKDWKPHNLFFGILYKDYTSTRRIAAPGGLPGPAPAPCLAHRGRLHRAPGAAPLSTFWWPQPRAGSALPRPQRGAGQCGGVCPSRWDNWKSINSYNVSWVESDKDNQFPILIDSCSHRIGLDFNVQCQVLHYCLLLRAFETWNHI